MSNKTICVSGGMDPVHSGHIRMIREASAYGDVIVILNSDDWLMRKKGYKFMSWEERAEILEAIKGVISVERVDDQDGTVCEALIRIKPDYFANGGDRKSENTPELEVCNSFGIEMIWGVGGGKTQSSSELISKVSGK
jgi:D-beta-D-heptose 7-phosphate kinase/D-beta-D-heptose 1-phosphate adenosyltransferase